MAYPFPTRAFRRNRERTSGLLFAFGVDDLSLTPPTGQTLTFARASGRTVVDSVGRVVTLAHSQPPWGARYNTTAGVFEPVYEPFDATTNRCLQSENFGTTWSAVNSPTRSAAAKTCGDLALDLIGDDNGGAVEGYTQAVTPSGGNGLKGVSMFVAQGSSTSSGIRVRDTTASANRLLAVLTWSSGAPVVTISGGTGTFLGAQRCANGVYRLLFSSATWTVANTNQIEVYPATDAALSTSATGTLYVGGVQVEDNTYPRGYVKTTTGTVTTVGDALTTPLGWDAQDFTLYVRFAKPAWALSATPGVASFAYLLRLAGSSGAEFSLFYDLNGAVLSTQLSDGTTTRTATASLPAGDAIDVCAQFQNILTGGTVRMDVGSGFGSTSSATGAFSAWGANASLRIGHANTSPALTNADTGIRKILMAPGARTLAQMAGLNV